MAYPQQYPPQPQYPVYPQQPVYVPPMPQPQPQPSYAPYPAQQYPQQPAQPPQPTAPGSLDQFYNQPAGGSGKAWSFHQKPMGTTYTGIVARPITNSDIQQQTDRNTNAPRYFRDGRPMFVMIVPMLVQPDAEFPEGVASWWVRGQARDELARAMAEAGAPEGPPEAGAAISVQLIGQRGGRAGFNPAYIYRVVYRRPAPTVDGAAPGLPVPGPAPAQQYTQQPVYGAPGHPVALTNPTGGSTVPVPMPQYPQQPAPQPAPVPAPQQPAQPQPAPVAVNSLNPDQQKLLAQLAGQTG